MFADFYYTYLVIPDGFFEEELGLTFQDQAGEIDDYSEDSTNRSLDIYKILNSEIKCWRKIATHNTVVNKKIIVTDWSFSFGLLMNQQNYNCKLSFLHTLMQRNYEIYVWTGQLVKANDMDSLIALLPQIVPIHQNSLISQLSDTNPLFNKDYYAIFDFHKMETIIEKWQQMTTAIEWKSSRNIIAPYLPSVYLQHLSPQALEQILASLDKNETTNIGINLKCDIVKLHVMLMAMIKAGIKLSYIIIGEEFMAAILPLPHDERQIFLKLLFSNELLANKISLELIDINLTDFFGMLLEYDIDLKRTSRLSLVYSSTNKLDFEVIGILASKKFPHLETVLMAEELVLMFDQTKDQWLLSKLAPCPNKIYSSQAILEMMPADPTIQKIMLRINKNNRLHTLFNKFNGIKYLYLETPDEETMICAFKELPQIEMLTLASFKQNPELKTESIKLALQINTLTLTNAGGYGGEIRGFDFLEWPSNLKKLVMERHYKNHSFDDHLVTRLEHAFLSKCDDQTIMLLLEKALNLRILEIYNGNFSSINQATHLMSKIEILKLGKMTASCQSLINLINSLPQLRILEFENCQITGQLAKHGLLRTTKIRQLTFDDSIIQDVHFFNHLLTFSPQLDGLDLDFNSWDNKKTPQSFIDCCLALEKHPAALNRLRRLLITPPSDEALGRHFLSFLIQHCQNLVFLRIMSNNVDDPFWDSLVTTRNMLSPKLRYLYIDELIFSSDDIKQVLENDSNNNNTKARLEEFYLNCARDGELTVVTAFVTDHAVVANPVAMDEKCEPARKGINTNTRGNSSHNVVEYFKPKRKDFPHPSIYREQAYDDFDLETFELIEARINPEIYTDYKSVVDLENYYETELANKEDHFLGQIKLNLHPNQWRILPGLTMHDKFLFLEKNEAIEIGHDRGARFYTVRLKSHIDFKLSCQVQYIIKADLSNRLSPIQTCSTTAQTKFETELEKFLLNPATSSKTFFNMETSSFINQLVKYFVTKFSPGDLKNVPFRINNQQLFQIIMQQKKGVCAHYAFCFLGTLKLYLNQKSKQKKLDLPTFFKFMVTSNKCHDFINIILDDQCFTYDLGGAPAELLIENFTTITPVSFKQASNENNNSIKSAPKLSANNRFITWHFNTSTLHSPELLAHWLLNHLWQNKINKQLILFSSQNEIELFNRSLMQLAGEYCYRYLYVPSLDEISRKTFRTNKIILPKNGAKEAEILDMDELIARLPTKSRKRKSALISDDKTPSATIDETNYENIDSEICQFLATAPEIPYLSFLMVNWSNSKSSHVGFNTLINSESPRLYETLLDDETKVILAMTQAEAHNIGEDLESRIDENILKVKFTQPDLFKERAQNSLHGALRNIDLYEDESSWLQKLMGKISFKGTQIEVYAGEILMALLEGYTGINLINAPWHSKTLRSFYDRLQVEQRFFFNGIYIHLPKNFTITYSQQVYTAERNYKISFLGHNPNMAWDFVLDTHTFRDFFITYEFNTSGLHDRPGWLQQKRLCILVTGSLKEGQWAKLLAEAKHCDIELIFIDKQKVPVLLEPQTNLLQAPPAPNIIKRLQYLPQCNRPGTTVLVSNDLDCLQKQAIDFYKPTITIAINESTSYEDLIERLYTIKINNKPVPHWQLCSIWKMLQNNHTVILKGKISNALAAKLATLLQPTPYLWVNGQYEPLKGQLVIITDDAKFWSSLNVCSQHDYDEIQIWQQLQEFSTDIKNPVYQLLADLKQARLYTETTGYAFLKNLMQQILLFLAEKLPLDIALRKATKRQFRLTKNANEINAWLDQRFPKIKSPLKPMPSKYTRLKKIKRQLSNSSYAFIVGPSGAGKTTFVIDQLPQLWLENFHEPLTVHVGLNSIEQWLIAKNDGKHILFIDEANLESEGKLDFLDGLNNQPPGILYQGQYYPLKPQHKVIFAGNPSNYANRQTHRFTLNQGRIELFKELTHDDLREDVIMPMLTALFEQSLAANEQNFITQLCLSTYDHLNKQLTARNLASICLRLKINLQYHSTYFQNNLCLALVMAIYDETKPYLKDKQSRQLFKKKLQSWYQNIDFVPFKKSLKQESQKLLQPSPAFKLTESRYTPWRRLHDQLLMRELRLSHPNLATAGTRAIVFEGEAGIGKSVMAIECLKAAGYEEITLNDSKPRHRKQYYYLTPTDLETMKATLLTAFNEGTIVVVDELNTLSALEPLLNDLLSGRYKGRPAQKEGFLLIGTQNPTTYQLRRALSKALANRSNIETIKTYKAEELFEIVFDITGDKQLTQDLVNEYIEASSYADNKQLRPAPTPRKLFSKAKTLTVTENTNTKNMKLDLTHASNITIVK